MRGVSTIDLDAATSSLAEGDAVALDAAQIDIDIVSSSGGLDELAADWQQLFERSRANPYASYAWVRTAWEHFGDDTRLRVGVARRGSRVVAILPLELRHYTVGPLRRPFLQTALGGWTTRNTFLMDETAADTLGPLLAQILRRIPDSDYCRLGRLAVVDTALPQIQTAARADGSEPSVAIYPTAIVDLPSTWEEFRAGLGQKLRHNVRYYDKVLARHGAVRLERIAPRCREWTGMGGLEQLLADALAVHPHTWQAREHEGRAIGDPDVVQFFEESSRALAARNLLDLSVLYAGDRPVSFMWGMTRHGSVYITKMGFDARLKECSPGVVHMARLAADCITRGETCIDLGSETLESKLRWCRERHQLADVLVYPNSLASRLIRWWRSDRRTQPPGS